MIELYGIKEKETSKKFISCRCVLFVTRSGLDLIILEYSGYARANNWALNKPKALKRDSNYNIDTCMSF